MSSCTILTSNLADVDVERELLVLQVEHLVVLVLLVHQVDTRSHVAASLELKTQGVARCLDAVGAWVIGAIEGTVCRTSRTIRAQSLVPSVASVAVGRAGGGMEPAPVAVENDALGLGRAATGGASRHRESGMLLSSERASLLSIDSRAEGESTESEGKGRHGCRLFQRPGLLALLDDERKWSMAPSPLYSPRSILLHIVVALT